MEKYFCNPYFPDEEIRDMKRLSNLPKVTEQENSKDRY